MLFSCGNDQEEDRWMQGPTAEAIDIPEIEWVPLAVVYLQENMILDNLSGNFNSKKPQNRLSPQWRKNDD